MEDRERINQMELVLAELIHSNELSEQRLSNSKGRLGALEKLQYISITFMVIIGGGTLFAIFRLLEII